MVARPLRAGSQHFTPAPAIGSGGGWLLPPFITAGLIPVLLSTAVALSAGWLIALTNQSLADSLFFSVPPPHFVSPPPAAPLIGLSPVFTPEVQRWAPDIVRWADAAGVPAELAATVMQIESCGHPSVRSSAGAAGLFQVMPFHFADGEDALDVETNARRGLAYLARAYVLSGGRMDLALAGYNGGHGLIERDPSAWPAETQRYVYWGTGILEDIQAGRTVSPRLDAWLQAGGTALCRRAAAAG
jgi:hypothetical protein